MSDQSKTDKANQPNQARPEQKASPEASLEAQAIPLQRTAAEKEAAGKDAGGRAQDEQAKANEQKLKDDADYAKSVEGTGLLLAPHLAKIREGRQSVENADPETQQRADRRNIRRLIGDLILDNGCGVMGGLTETEQAYARALAIKLKA